MRVLPASNIFVWIVTFAMALPGGSHAQAAPYLTALVIPPAGIGTCLPLGAVGSGEKTTPVSPFITTRLVITTLSPNGRREIVVRRDSLGQLRGYSEMTLRSTGLTSGASDAVSAFTDKAGRLTGMRTHTTTVLPPQTLRPSRDSAELHARLRAMRANAGSTSSHQALDSATQASVQRMAEWMRTRCPH